MEKEISTSLIWLIRPWDKTAADPKDRVVHANSGYCLREIPVDCGPQTIRLTRRFLELVEQKFAIMKRVSDYAKDLSVNSNYLNATVKKVSGLSARQHIRHRVILEAKRKATTDELSMKEVAGQLGFDDIAHFSKYFKNGCGLNFSAFKKDVNRSTLLSYVE